MSRSGYGYDLLRDQWVWVWVWVAGGLSDGVEHTALTTLYLDNATGNGGSYNVNEIVTGSISGVQGTVVWGGKSFCGSVQDH